MRLSKQEPMDTCSQLGCFVGLANHILSDKIEHLGNHFRSCIVGGEDDRTIGNRIQMGSNFNAADIGTNNRYRGLTS